MQRLIIDKKENIYADVCPNLTKPIIDKLVTISPLSSIDKDKITYLYNDIVFAYDIKMRDAKLVGMYVPALKKFILNMGLENAVTKDCNINTANATNEFLRLMSMGIVHELIHHIFTIKYDESFLKPICISYYKVFWENLLDPHKITETNLTYISRLNYYIAVNLRLFTPVKPEEKLTLNKMVHVLDSNGYFPNNYKQETIKILDAIGNGQPEVKLNNKLTECFETAYKHIYNDVPIKTKYGQELVNSSEIISCSAQTETPKALSIAKHMLNLVNVDQENTEEKIAAFYI